MISDSRDDDVVLRALSAHRPSVWTGTFGSGQTEAAVFPEHGVQGSSGSFWSNAASLEGSWGGCWHGPKPMAVPAKPQKELCDCGAGFGAIRWHNARLYLSVRNRNRRVCFSQQWHFERSYMQKDRRIVLIIHKQSLNLNSLLTSTTPASVWNHNDFIIIWTIHLLSWSSFHSSDF